MSGSGRWDRGKGVEVSFVLEGLSSVPEGIPCWWKGPLGQRDGFVRVRCLWGLQGRCEKVLVGPGASHGHSSPSYLQQAPEQGLRG